MKILILSWEYPPETGGGGIGSYVACMAPALVARGNEVHVLSCAPGQAETDYVDRGVQVHRRPQLVVRGFGRISRSVHAHARLNLAWSHWHHARTLGFYPDVVEAPECCAEGLFFSLTQVRPLVIHLHTPLHAFLLADRRPIGWSERLGDMLERRSARGSRILSCPSQLLATYLRRSGWISDRQVVRVIPYPIDLETWSRCSSVSSTGPTVLSVGRLEPLKGGDVLIRAARLLKMQGSEIELVFVGRSTQRPDGSLYRAELERLADMAGVACHFVEQVDRADLIEWYGRARVIAVPSRFDNFPMAALEAMASGRPVVCTSRVGTSELLMEKSSGAIVAPDDSVALADALRPYLTDRALAERDGRAARALVAERCAPQTVAQEREELYREAIRHWDGARRRIPRRFTELVTALTFKA
jgi:glycogen(starch) synthase